jgi:AmiR/NasT family two-component response regulator
LDIDGAAIPLPTASVSRETLWATDATASLLEDLQFAAARWAVFVASVRRERAIHRGQVLTEQPQTALTSRVMIEQAKGVLAHHSGLGTDQAFNLLRDYARSHNQRLSHVARRLTGKELDPAQMLTTPTGDTDARRR